MTATEDLEVGDVLWETPVNGRAMSSAAFDGDALYVGTAGGSASTPSGTLYRLHQETGEPVWDQSFPNWLMAAPALSSTRVYVGCDDTQLYCLNKADGEILWHFDTAGRIDSTPCLDTQGRCYFGSRDRFVYALDHEGALLWSHFLTGGVASSPVLDEREGRLYVADLANTIYALDLEGNRLWSYKPRQGNVMGVRLRIYSSPCLDDQNYLYVGSGDHFLYAVDRTSGNLFWREDTGDLVDSSPVIGTDGSLYVAHRGGELLKYFTEPFIAEREIWRNPDIGQVFYGSPTIDREGNVYICGAPPLTEGETEPQSQLSYIDQESGEILWSTTFPGYTDATPVLDTAGNVYIGTANERFYKIHGAGNPLDDASWPTFRGHPTGHGRFEQTFSKWLTSFQIPPEFAGTGRDSDGDGFRDLEEFAAGTSPRDAHDFPRLTIGSQRFTFPLQKGVRARFQLQTSPRLETWEASPLPLPSFQFEDLGERWDISTSLPLDGAAPRFLRIFWQTAN